MNIKADDTSVDTEVSTPEVTETPEIEAAAPEATPAEGDAPPAEAAPIPEYKPDLKYKVFREERDLDPRVASIIKSKDDEEWIKKVFSAADGVEVFKSQHEAIRNEYQNITNTVNDVLKTFDLGDYKGAFEKMGVKTDLPSLLNGMGYSKDEIIRHAYQLAQLTPQEESAYARQQELERQNKELQMQASSYQEQQQQMQLQSLDFSLRQVLSQPDIAPIANAYDQTKGQGAFWDLVAERGDMYFQRTKQIVPPQQLVSEVVDLLKFGQSLNIQGQQQQPQQQQQGQPAPAAPRSPQELPVIPSVGSGGSQTPVMKRPKTLAQLKQFAATLSDD